MSARHGLAAVAVLGALAAGCGKKSDSGGPAPELTGLAAVPANADIVISADVAKLARSPLVGRAIDQILTGNPTLAEQWKQVREGCKIDVPKQVTHILLALGPTPPGKRAGTGPAIMVATGDLPENHLTDCVRGLVGKGGGAVTGKAVGGRTVYEVKEGARALYFAYGRPDTVVVGNDEAYVIEAIGPGAKAPTHPELAAWMKLVDAKSPVWAVGRMDARVRQGLVGVFPTLKAGPSAIVATIDPTDGANLALGAVMASTEDAKQLESLTNDQKKFIAMAAQARSLGKVVNKVTIQTAGTITWFRAPLTMADVNSLLSALDGDGSSEQDSPPATPGGSNAP